MKLVTTVVIAVLVSASSVVAGDIPANSVKKIRVKPDHGYVWAKVQYPWMDYRDTLFCAESEFLWPEGFHRPDSQSLTPYQFWISYLPLWHSRRPVGSLFNGKVFDAEQVSRPVHFSRWKTRFADKTIPLELWAQFFLNQKRQFDLRVTPYVGKPLAYKDYLANSVAYNARGEVIYTPTDKRADSEDEFAGFVEFCDHQTTYRSLAANCDSVSAGDLKPGDMYITWNENGVKGTVAIVLTVIMNAGGEKLYTVGVGCPDECDFYIPLFNNDRNYPWISAAQVPTLFPSKGTAGFFRPRVK
jgi:hypothetical protein